MLSTEIADLLLAPEGYLFNASPEKKGFATLA